MNKNNTAFSIKIFAALTISLFLLSNIATINANTIKNNEINSTYYVDDDAAPGWYDGFHTKTITEAVKNASSGDTIYVHNGTYYENILIDKKITLTGENKENTIIDSGKTGSQLAIVVDQVSVSNFTLTNASDSLFPGYIENGVDIGSNGNKIYNNIITNNYRGINLIDSSDNEIYNNIIIDNFGNFGNKKWGSGIVLLRSSNNKIYNNTITNNPSSGITISINSNENNIYENIVNDSSTGISIFESSSNVVEKNDISNSNFGLKLEDLSNKNIISKNNFIANNRHASFKIKRFFPRNIWSNNYWGEPRTLPMIIHGKIGRIFSIIPFIAIDLTPANQPY